MMRIQKKLFSGGGVIALASLLCLTACQPLAPLLTRLPTAATRPATSSNDTLTPGINDFSPTYTDTASLASPSPSDTTIPSNTSGASAYATPGPAPLPMSLNLDPADWKNWPVIPTVTERARTIYRIGQSLGNDPHAFSVFGDCQSEPQAFMGAYESDSAVIASLNTSLLETVTWFSGSFNRKSPTVRGGTTAAALLWSVWHQNKFGCTIYESPVACELRIHKPSFVIINVGTHYENRNDEYMRTILDQLIAAGVVPILASKADDRELDDRVNAAYARLAVEYNIPFWNFWAAVDGLPNRGLYTRPDAQYQGDLYLTDEAAAIHRLSALQVLDAVRRAVVGP